MTTLEKMKLAIRRSHDKLDSDLQDEIDACLADLRVHGITHAGEDDPLILNALKLWCRAFNTDDVAKAAEYRERYEALRASLSIAEGYGWEEPADE